MLFLVSVCKSGRYGEHFHCVVVLIVPESSGAFVLYSFVYVDSLKVRMFRWELEGRRLDVEEEAFFEYADRLRECKGVGENAR
jgi:hypothetical protein